MHVRIASLFLLLAGLAACYQVRLNRERSGAVEKAALSERSECCGFRNGPGSRTHLPHLVLRQEMAWEGRLLRPDHSGIAVRNIAA